MVITLYNDNVVFREINIGIEEKSLFLVSDTIPI